MVRLEEQCGSDMLTVDAGSDTMALTAFSVCKQDACNVQIWP